MHHTVGYKLDEVYYNLKEGLHTTRRRSIVRDERSHRSTIKYRIQGLSGDNYKLRPNRHLKPRVRAEALARAKKATKISCQGQEHGEGHHCATLRIGLTNRGQVY